MSTIPGIHSFAYQQQAPRVFDAANGLVETGLWECTKCGKRNPKNKEWYDTCVPDAPNDHEGQAALLDETYDTRQLPTQPRTLECLPVDSNASGGGEKGAREGTPTAPDRPSRFPTREVAGNIKAPPAVAPVTGGVKLDQGKARWDLLPCDALDAVAEVLTFGAKKYTQYGECTCNAATAGGLRNQAGSSVHSSTCATRTIVRTGERNWELGMDWGRLQGALMRHVAAWAQGRDIDEESGKLHLAHAATCALMLLALTQREVGKDDRGDVCLT